MKEDLESQQLHGRPGASTKAKRSRLVLGAVSVLALTALAVAVGYWLSLQRSAGTEEALAAVPLTSCPGFENAPSFSPGGNSVAIQQCGEAPGPDCDFYIEQIGVEPPFPLANDAALDFSPALSPWGWT